MCWKGSCSNALQRNLVQDSTTARTVLAATLEIITISGNDLNQAYLVPKECSMPKCLHTSATPMQQIQHIIACPEASKGEIRCYTCKECHDFKRWHAVCNTLKSPIELLRRLSTKKRGSISSAGEPFATKRGKTTASNGFMTPSRQQIEEMEDPDSLFLARLNSAPGPAQLHADEANDIHMASELGDSSAIRPLPTPPSTRDHSWSENSQNMVAYGDAKVAHVPEQPPPYMVSPQTTFDDYRSHDNPTDTLRLNIPPVQYIHESNFIMESPDDMEMPEADRPPWASHPVFREAEDHPQVNLGLAPTVLDATVSTQYGTPSEKSASIFSRSFPASRIPDPRRPKQTSWPTQLHCPDDVPRPSFDRQHHQIFNGTHGLTEHDGPAAPVFQKGTGTEPSISRQTSFDTGAQDSITVGLFDRGHQATSRAPPGEEHQATAQQQQHATQARQFEECGRCGRRFGGIAKNRRQHLRRHVASKHGGARFYCGHAECACSYNRVDNLHDHERKVHGFVLPPKGGGGGGCSEVAELAAGDAEHHGGGAEYCAAVVAAAAPEAEVSAPEAGRTLITLDAHLAVFEYAISTEEGPGWHLGGPDGFLDEWRTTGTSEEERGEIIAGVSGGHEGEVGVVAEMGHEADTSEDCLSTGLDLAPRPLHLPGASWRA